MNLSVIKLYFYIVIVEKIITFEKTILHINFITNLVINRDVQGFLNLYLMLMYVG